MGRGGDAGKMAKREVIFILTSSVAHHVFYLITHYVIILV